MTDTVSVVICAYTLDRWEDLNAAIASVRAQDPEPDQLIVVVDHDRPLADRLRHEEPSLTLVENGHRRGLSGARNTGVAASAGSIVAFLDDDAVATPGWLARLISDYRDPRVMGVGGRVEAAWDRPRPAWFPPEFDWVIGCSYRGARETRGAVRNFIGANMSFRRTVFETIGGFREEIGRVGRRPIGCDETELCIRAAARWPDRILLHDPAVRVVHRVRSERATWGYFVARCHAEGRSKALVTRFAGARRGLASERRYLSRSLPAGVLRGLGDAARLRISGLLRTGVIISGAAFTIAGYLSASLIPNPSALARDDAA